MEYYVYILRSVKNNDIYIGSTANFQKRLVLHNSGKVRSTKPYCPWVLLETRRFQSRGEAVLQERFLKQHWQKEMIKKKYNV